MHYAICTWHNFCRQNSQARLEEDLASLKTQLDQFPQTLHMHNELHNLRAQLSDARLRLASTTSGLLDSNRLAVLEQALHELQAVSKQGLLFILNGTCP